MTKRKQGMSRETQAELFMIQVSGAVAHMFALREVEPTHDEWEMLRGYREVSMRGLSNIAYDLGFDLDIIKSDETKHFPPEGEDERD